METEAIVQKEKITDDRNTQCFQFKKTSGVYNVSQECTFYEFCEKIHFKGFNKLPKGFYKNGYGFAKPASTFLTSILQGRLGKKVKITISKSDASSIGREKNSYHLIFNHADYISILETIRAINTEKNQRSNQHILSELYRLFSRYFKHSIGIKTPYSYEKDKLTKIFNSEKDIIKLLTKNDIDTVVALYDQIVKDSSIDFKSVAVYEKSKKKTERIYLNSIIKEYERRLNIQSLSEADWQRFLQKYILLFNTSYIHVIEKLNVDLRGRYPDFILANIYGYLDIFEIKKPTTNLLKHDDSRDNYFWDVEISKAIIQTEKYIQMLIRKDKDIIDVINDKYNLNVKIIRPRGFIVAGNSEQLENKKMENDFRLLSSALKNVDIILYDELKENLKNLIKRLK